MHQNDALFLYVNDGKNIAKGDNLISDVYTRFSDKDDHFLYVVYSSETVMGDLIV